MKKKKKNGLTLVELLAVIVILGIILVIAVPQISSVVEAGKERTLSASAKKIAIGAEEEYLERKTKGDFAFLNLETVPCDEFADITSDYGNCEVSFTKGKAFVNIEGTGKFKGKYICVGTKEEAIVQNQACNFVEIAEEKLIIAAKEYTKNVDPSFDSKFTNVGDKNYIYKTDLLNAELISKNDLSKLNTLGGVKGELLSNNKIDYSIEYINADPSEYTNEELYLMIQSLQNGNSGGSGSGGGSIDNSVINDLQSQINQINTQTSNNNSAINNLQTQVNQNKEAIENVNTGVDSSVINDLQSQINENKTQINTNKVELEEIDTKANNNATLITTNTTLINQYSTNMSNLTNKNNANNVFLKTYPVGSIYISNSNTNPGTIFGGTWVSFGTGRTLVGVDDSQTEFATVEKTGGEKTHTLTEDEMPSHVHDFTTSSTSKELTGGINFAAVAISTNMSNNFSNIVASAGGVFSKRIVSASSIQAGPSGTTAINDIYRGIDIDATHTHSGTSQKIGGSGAHNNLQPYITVYMWKRTA